MPIEKPVEIVPASVEGRATTPRWVVMAFVISGLAGLVYEVVYSKALAVTFGSTALASYTVLATYMGGMALGAWLGGFLADRAKSSLKAYAVCELIIGLYAVVTPQLFELIQAVYVRVSLDVAPDAAWLTPFKLALGAGCLSIPTILMGATLPFMFKYLRTLGVSSSRSIAPLYAANVAGAAIGSVLAGYFLLPAVGRNGGTYIAAIISLIIALYVLDRQKKASENVSLSSAISAKINTTNDVVDTKSIAKFGVMATLVLFVGGTVTLGLEVNSMHLLAIVAGNSVYAFGLMLSTFLAGLGIGSIVGEKLTQNFSRIKILTWAQCGIALAVALTAHLWDDIPSYFASFSLYPMPLSFSAREVIRATVCAVAMFPPAFFIGMSYPSAMSLATDWLSPSGEAKGVGIASALNTLGNILGVVIVGFWLLPNFGSHNTSLILGVLALTLGTTAIFVQMQDRMRGIYSRSMVGTFSNAAPVLMATFALSFFPKNWNYNDLSTGANVYFSSQNWGDVIDHAESVEGGLTTVAKNKDGVSILLTNGKFQGNNSAGGKMLAQESFALFPLMHTKNRDSVLVIDYGIGMTACVFHDMGFARIDVAELSRDIAKMADRYFENINSENLIRPRCENALHGGQKFFADSVASI